MCVCVCAYPVRVGLSIYISVYLSVHCDGRLLCALCHALFLYFPCFFVLVFCFSYFAAPCQLLVQFIVCPTFLGQGQQMTKTPHLHPHIRTVSFCLLLIITPRIASINKSEVNFAMCLARKCLVNRAMAMGQQRQPYRRTARASNMVVFQERTQICCSSRRIQICHAISTQTSQR